MTSLQLALILVASIWAAVSTLISGYIAVNATRDRVLTGFTDEGVPLTVRHRRMMYQNDWLPMKVGLAFVSLAFGLFLTFLPTLADNATALRWLCYLASALPFGSFLGFFVLGVRDRNHMVDVLDSLSR